MSTPLFVGSYLQVTSLGGLSANEKEETFALNDNYLYGSKTIGAQLAVLYMVLIFQFSMKQIWSTRCA